VVATVPPEYYGDDREVYKAAFQRNREGFSPDGRNSMAAVQNVYKILEAFEPAVKGAKIDLSKTFDNQYVEAALKRIK
jgi:NitT/TauT family transport system substrate-binding protein